MIAEAEFKAVLEAHCLLRGSPRVLPRGHIRIDTRLLYPDGAAISVFIEQGHLGRPNGYAISDLGRTFAKLDEYGVNPFLKNRLQAIQETVGALGVTLMNDRLVMELEELGELNDGIFDLAQACIRASCMIFTRRASQQLEIAEKVHELMQMSGLSFHRDYQFLGPYGNPVKVDYRVANPNKTSSVLIMKGSHSQANEVLSRWFDLRQASVQDRFVTVFDEQKPVEKPSDLQRLNDISEVVSVTHPAMLEQLLKAA